VPSCSPGQEQLTAHSDTSQKLQILNKLTVIFYVQTTTLPHRITARGQSKRQDVLYQLHQTAQLHLETLQVAWSTDHHHHVQHNQVEPQSALQPEVHNPAVTHYINTTVHVTLKHRYSVHAVVCTHVSNTAINTLTHLCPSICMHVLPTKYINTGRAVTDSPSITQYLWQTIIIQIL
jgi:hypothetical protein